MEIDEPIRIGNVGSYAERAIREGMSQRRFYDAFRENRIDVSRKDIRDAYNNTRQAMLSRGDVQALPYHRTPEASFFTPWQAGKAGSYAYQVNVRIMDTDTGKMIDRPWMVKSDAPISINNAISQAVEQAEAGIESGSYAGEEIVSATISGLYSMKGSG